MSKRIILSVSVLLGAVFANSEVANAETPDSNSSYIQCTLSWQPDSLPKGTILYYSSANVGNNSYYTIEVEKEVGGPKGKVQHQNYSFYIDYQSDGNPPPLASTMRREVTEYIFDTKIYGIHHTHLKGVGHDKIKRKVSSETFGNIRNMLPGEILTVEARQRANKSKKAYGKKWVKAENNYLVELVGCKNQTFAGESFKTRTYILKYDELNFSGNKNNAVRPQNHRITLDEQTGIVLEMVNMEADGTKRNSAYLTKIEQ